MLMLYLDQERVITTSKVPLNNETCAFVINYFLHSISPAEIRVLSEVRKEVAEINRATNGIKYS